MADILPGYLYEPATSRYRSAQSGKFVSRADITDLLREQVQSAEARLHDIATAYHEGKISSTSFVDLLRTEQRRLTLQNIALAKGGFDRLDQRSYGKAGASLRQQYAKIIGTAQDVVDGKVSLPQLLNRIDGYVGEGRRLYFETERENKPEAPEDMTTIERRQLGNADHCDDCISYYEQGWQVAGVLPSPGNACKCQSHCRCGLISRNVPTLELGDWIGSKS